MISVKGVRNIGKCVLVVYNVVMGGVVFFGFDCMVVNGFLVCVDCIGRGFFEISGKIFECVECINDVFDVGIVVWVCCV